MQRLEREPPHSKRGLAAPLELDDAHGRFIGLDLLRLFAQDLFWRVRQRGVFRNDGSRLLR